MKICKESRRLWMKLSASIDDLFFTSLGRRAGPWRLQITWMQTGIEMIQNSASFPIGTGLFLICPYFTILIEILGFYQGFYFSIEHKVCFFCPLKLVSLWEFLFTSSSTSRYPLGNVAPVVGLSFLSFPSCWSLAS